MLTVTVTGGVASSNTITTGNNNASIAGVDAADAIAVVAGATDDDNTLTLSGLADFNVTGLIGNLQASALPRATSTSPPEPSPGCRSPPATAATPSTPRRSPTIRC